MDYVILISLLILVILIIISAFIYFSSQNSDINISDLNSGLVYENTLFSDNPYIEYFDPSKYSQFSWMYRNLSPKGVIITEENSEPLSNQISFVNNSVNVNNWIEISGDNNVIIDWNNIDNDIEKRIKPQTGFVFTRVEKNRWLLINKFNISLYPV